MDDSRYYKPSGAAPLGGIFSAVSISGTAALLAGALYGVVDYYNPLIYVNFLGTLFLSVIVGGITFRRLTSGRIRSRVVSTLIGLLVATVMCYGAWVAYIFALSEWDALVVDPLSLFEVIQVVATNGVWSIKKHTPTGWELYLAWLIEAGVIYAFVLTSALETQPPYCEECDERTEPEVTKHPLALCAVPVLRDELEGEQYASLLEAIRTEVNPRSFLALSINTCPRCRERAFLQISNVAIVTNKEGNDETKETVAVPWISVDSRHRAQIMDAIQSERQPAVEDDVQELTETLDDAEAAS